jgi:hypothetical protein
MSQPPEDPVLKSARREAIVAGLLWAAAALYTIVYCALHGYNRDPKTLTFVLGFPDWVFWGVIVPWIVCVALSFWFALAFMKDEDLGQELEDRDGD